jgi:diphthine synthase
MLLFIGLGLFDEKDLSLKAIDSARSCELLFAEFYTSKLAGTSVEKLESVFKKKIRVLTRDEVEGSEIILNQAKKKKVGFLVPGDPLISTTHTALRLSAKEKGIKSAVVHNTSIHSAAPAISGLFNYKFGRSTSIPFPTDGYTPESYYNVIGENKRQGLHTLVFLDIKEKLMTVNEGIDLLLKIEEKRNENVIQDETILVGLGHVGSDKTVIRAGRVREIKKVDFGPPPHVMIFPGKLHFMEEEYLKEFGGLKEL